MYQIEIPLTSTVSYGTYSSRYGCRRYSTILVLNTLIGWRAYLILDGRQAVGGSGESSRTGLLGKFHFASLGVTKAPHFRRPSCTSGHTVTMTNLCQAVAGRAAWHIQVLREGHRRRQAEVLVVVRLLRLWAWATTFRAPRRRRRFKPTRASTERRSLLAQARIGSAASRARISRGTTGRSPLGRVRETVMCMLGG